jgi:hypothetical protein
MKNREKPCRHDGENRHRFGAPVDRRPESRAEQIQNGGDQCAGVSDTDPEDEGDDVHTPHHGRVVSGNAKPGIDLVHPGGDADQQEENRNAEPDEPRDRRMQRSCYLAIDLLVITNCGQLYVRGGDIRAAGFVDYAIGSSHRSHP